MATDDRDMLSGPVPEPDAEPTATERAHAKTFADIVDKTLLGRAPAAMSADDRALLEVATVIRAASGNAELSASKQRSAVEDALRQAIGGNPATSGSLGSGLSVPITRSRTRRIVPWAISGVSVLVAAAALIALWVRAPRQVSVPHEVAGIPAEWKSRPADVLIGPIAHEHSADASARLDTIFADRLEGYRERRLERRRKP
ncbi:MAG: hypothetical protein JWO36_6609 [Myxococcales bacterium]|nr:hypothetical protein [Myxococcales bacterium]